VTQCRRALAHKTALRTPSKAEGRLSANPINVSVHRPPAILATAE
jgi:hypothetical protein